MVSIRVEEEDCPDAKFHKLMWGYEDEEKESLPLPPIIKIKDPMPGELPFMRKRRGPAVLRFRKQKQEVNREKYALREMFLFDPNSKEVLFELSGDEVMQRYERIKARKLASLWKRAISWTWRRLQLSWMLQMSRKMMSWKVVMKSTRNMNTSTLGRRSNRETSASTERSMCQNGMS